VGNEPVLRQAYLTQHPLSVAKWEESIEGDDPARAFYLALYRDEKLIGKGEFAHDLAGLIKGGHSFVCPDYLADAIRFI
jgi:putative ATP-dependent endonuclease of OLD family